MLLRARQLLDRTGNGNPLPEGTLSVGGGLLVLGLTAYAFFVIAARALGPERYATLSVLWTLVFAAAPGVFFPLEQEVGRAVSARRALGVSGGPVVRRAALAAGVLAAVLIVVSLAFSRFITDELFDGDRLLLVALLVSLPAYAASHLGRGTLSGNGRFGAYGTALAAEGLLRVLAALVLAGVSYRVAGGYGLLIGAAPVVAMTVVLSRERGLIEHGPEAPWAELSGALGWLLVGAVLSQGFVNASVPLVKVLAADGESAIAGQFQAGLIISRVPLFLFQAVQAALLPKLAGLAASGRLTDFRTGLRRLVVVVVAIGVAGTLGAFAIGPFVLRLAFGHEFDALGNVDLGLLALSSAAFMLATALAQALIALRGHARVAFGWFVAIVVFVAVIAAGSGLLARVEAALVTGSIVATIVMAILLTRAMNAGVPDDSSVLLDYNSPTHEIIEP